MQDACVYLSLNPIIAPGNLFCSLVVAMIAAVPTLASLLSKFTPTTKGALRAKKKVSFQNEILNVIVTSILIISAALNKCHPPKKIC